jgi:aryl-alcohol dehydrogenase-like predicted oxidoreductase
MQYRRLGRTGLNVSMLSLGSGGPNRFGQSRYTPRNSILRLVRHALELGINFFDSASSYGQSETLLGKALQGVPRDGYYLSTKVLPVNRHTIISAAEARRLVKQSLHRLGLEELDILHLHRVTPQFYEKVRDRLMPELERLRAEGKIRYIGITESSHLDPQHRMMKHALQDDCFDTVMVAYNLANLSAEEELFPLAMTKDVGVIGMVAARHLVSRSAGERLKLLSRALVSLAASPPGRDKLKIRLQGVLSTLKPTTAGQIIPVPRDSGGEPLLLPRAGYTFAVSHPAIATVLTGTNDLSHLEQNLEATLAPALTSEEVRLLRVMLD